MWEYAVRHATFVRSRVLNKKSSEITPFERIYEAKPSVSNMREFGEAVAVQMFKSPKRHEKACDFYQKCRLARSWATVTSPLASCTIPARQHQWYAHHATSSSWEDVKGTT